MLLKETNSMPMPYTKPKRNKKTWPCGKCNKVCIYDYICCDECNTWYHRECETLTSAEFIYLSNESSSCYVCKNCNASCNGKYDFKKGLARFQKVID